MYDWKEEYCIGNEKIDSQHHELFTICNRIEKIFSDSDAQKNKRAVVEGIKYLKEYTLQHFENEEELQRSIGYEEYEQHKSVHEYFRKQILVYEQKLDENQYSYKSVYAFLEMVKNWLVHHILGMDQNITHVNLH